MQDIQQLIADYHAAPDLLRELVQDLPSVQLDAVPIAGRWSIRQVVCHLADFEIVYADRIKRVIAEFEPTLFGGDPDAFAGSLAYQHRQLDIELDTISSVRRQIASILTELGDSDFQRIGRHSEAGPINLASLVRSITDHIPHHSRFIQEKLDALGG